MKINKALVEWRKTKDISLASDICSALIEMLEDEDCEVINYASYKRRDVTIRFENDTHELLLIKQDRMNHARMSVLEEDNGQS